MEFKGTKGKWIIDNEEIGYNEYHQLCTPISVNGIIGFCDVYGDDEQSKANALLISKAPEMLEMLMRAENWCASCNQNASIVKDIQKLIKEATEI